MELTFDSKNTKRAQRRVADRKRKERMARIVNVKGGYDDDPAGLRRAVVKRLASETTGRHRIDRNIVGGTIKRLERYELELEEALSYQRPPPPGGAGQGRLSHACPMKVSPQTP